MVCIVGFGLVGLFEHIIWILLGPDVMGLLQLILKSRIADIFVTSHTFTSAEWHVNLPAVAGIIVTSHTRLSVIYTSSAY